MTLRRAAPGLIVALLVLLSTCLATRAGAASPQLPESLRACMQQRDSLRRLACYDDAVAALGATAPLGEEQLVRKSQPPPEPAEEATLTATISALREKPDGSYVISLDNGQAWTQVEVDRGFPMRVGSVVRIEPGMMRSYRLLLGAEGRSRWTRVRRIR